jgi:hypothetical protein
MEPILFGLNAHYIPKYHTITTPEPTISNQAEITKST